MGFYSSHYKVYINLPCINTQQQTIAKLNNNPIVSFRNHRTIGLYQGSIYRCERYRNSCRICLLQPSHKIHYCNHSVLEIFLGLNKTVFSITEFDLILRSAQMWLCQLRASFLYISKWLSFYFFLFVTGIATFCSPLSWVSLPYWYYKKLFYGLCDIFWFCSYNFKDYIHLHYINTQHQTKT